MNGATAEAAMPALVINLDRSPERWAFMERHCRVRGFAVARVAAVDGRALPAAEVDRRLVPVEGTRRISSDEVACFESHKKAWRALIETGAPWGLVLEDDVFLAVETAMLCAQFEKTAPVAIVKLNSYRKPIYVFEAPLWQGSGFQLLAPAQKTIDGSAYLMSREGAEAALARFERYSEELDLALFDPDGGIGVAQVVPALSVQQKFADFDFLEDAAQASAIEGGRAEERSAAKRARGRRSPVAVAAAEWDRFVRRRLRPRLLGLTNLLRPADRRLARLLVEFPRPAGAGS
jgi:glycosyl transferase family 25